MRSYRTSLSSTISQASRLVTAFLDRAGSPSLSAWEVIRGSVLSLRQHAIRVDDDLLTSCARLRNIVSIREEEDIAGDGFIEPLGASLADGFRVVLRKGAPNSRQRFTLAHEICHTFFYEAAPELKLGANHEDPFEEALCNYGASCLLMPEDVIRPNALASNPCLASLESLSQLFAVSHEAMIVRLRDMGLWKCEYSLWHRMTTGEFAIDKLYGWPKLDWHWADVSLPQKAWDSGRLHRGIAVLWWQTTSGYSTAKNVHYELRRRGTSLVALWQDMKLYEEQPPLLRAHQQPPRKRAGIRPKAMRKGQPAAYFVARLNQKYWWSE
jgi:hypothetical protein